MLIESSQNPKYKQLLKLHQAKYRSSFRRFLIEGQHLVEEAYRANQLETLILKKGDVFSLGNIDRIELDEKMFKALSVTASSNVVMGVCMIPQQEEISGQRFLLCDRIQDPGNMGTLIRSAHAFGFDQVIVSLDCVDVYNDKVVRSTQGALFHIPILQMELNQAIKEIQSKSISVYGTGFKNSTKLSIIDTKPHCALLVGNEGAGVKESLLKQCDEIIQIEMNGFESLNVGVAAGILLYHFRKP